MINEKVKELRKIAGISQAKLAKLLNVSRQAVGHYEQGYREIPLDIVKKYCIIFDITSDELLEIETQQQRNEIKIDNSFNKSKITGNINIGNKK